MAGIRVVVIEPTRLLRANKSAQRLLAKLTTAVLAENNTHLQLYNQATATWNGKPSWKKTLRATATYIAAEISTSSKPFAYVEGGTSVRYATMTRNFSPKSRPGSLRASPGAGGRAYVSRMVPRRGIVARNFTTTIVNKRYPVFVAKVTRIVHGVGSWV
jgi:hypothetical protein